MNAGNANRGYQLNQGALNSNSDWILFLHADSRLQKEWVDIVKKTINKPTSKNHGWFFELRVDSDNIDFRLMELAVTIRSNLMNQPYGDQGLLIHKDLYTEVGGFKHLEIMEDVDIASRLRYKSCLKSLGNIILTSPRRWNGKNILRVGILNAILRYQWRQGRSSIELYKTYYKKNQEYFID